MYGPTLVGLLTEPSGRKSGLYGQPKTTIPDTRILAHPKNGYMSNWIGLATLAGYALEYGQ